jgi:hypothetical protein
MLSTKEALSNLKKKKINNLSKDENDKISKKLTLIYTLML